MPEIQFLQADGRVDRVDAPVGVSIMKAAVGAGVPGILAECGGQAMCATCHVHIRYTPVVLPEVGEDEDEMLDCALSPRAESSRLSCQVTVEASYDGMSVYVPAEDL
ncbi:ferredoxin [Rhodococcus sp. 06-462-5]|uniref:2Fe-2S iron-sulfur cluster-binding protein n=1 Tax=unclassified Rhodococcus (in: high G+C Gram-positive bacteria) TaxID=192944 RepID=UPI000B9AE805|nr:MULTISPECIES: 2Fe-2S iron-sulfur cluster-binding protein [unclassified Rhodococcus (in: high G+C Gram-positive bacteria)]OZC73635.1 ferredoxin [Rhodococcus sp. 06-462-5]OZE63444.1 ferredoxin [Rhodococcus sp. 02-925g]